MLRGQVTTLFAFLIEARGLRAGHLRERVDELLLSWLRHPASYGDDPKPHPNVQRYSYVERVADLINAGTLRVAEDREALKRFLHWVDNWDAGEKSDISTLITYLENNHPAPALWDIVKFE